MKKYIIIIALGISFGLAPIAHAETSAKPMDQCQRALEQVKAHQQGLLSVVRINVKANALFTNFKFGSRDCRGFSLIEREDAPPVMSVKDGLCFVLTASDIKKGLRCLRSKLCVSPGNCREVTWRLHWNSKQKTYTSATPVYQTVKFRH